MFVLIGITAFASISTHITTEYVLGRSVDTDDPILAKDVYRSGPDVDYMPQAVFVTTVKDIAAETEPPVQEWSPDQNDVEMIAQVIYNEAECCTMTEQAAVAWCVLNRVDDPRFPDSIREVVTSPRQFVFDWNTPVLPELCRLAEDVMHRWHDEKEGVPDVGRVLPAEYCFFRGDGWHNHFRLTDTAQVYYDWTLTSPYED